MNLIKNFSGDDEKINELILNKFCKVLNFKDKRVKAFIN